MKQQNPKKMINILIIVLSCVCAIFLTVGLIKLQGSEFEDEIFARVFLSLSAALVPLIVMFTVIRFKNAKTFDSMSNLNLNPTKIMDQQLTLLRNNIKLQTLQIRELQAKLNEPLDPIDDGENVTIANANTIIINNTLKLQNLQIRELEKKEKDAKSDWICSHCNTKNFADDTNCHTCGAARE